MTLNYLFLGLKTLLIGTRETMYLAGLDCTVFFLFAPG